VSDVIPGSPDIWAALGRPARLRLVAEATTFKPAKLPGQEGIAATDAARLRERRGKSCSNCESVSGGICIFGGACRVVLVCAGVGADALAVSGGDGDVGGGAYAGMSGVLALFVAGSCPSGCTKYARAAAATLSDGSG
jgi:hypothetical protein